MEALDTLAPDVGTKAACEALGISRASLYRHKGRSHVAAVEPEKRSAPPRALGPEEKRQVLELMNSERFMDKAPQEIHATLLDEGVYLCSTRTMYRILEEHGELKERRNQLCHPAYEKPELLAEAPNQV
jgi:hypothetical protein